MGTHKNLQHTLTDRSSVAFRFRLSARTCTEQSAGQSGQNAVDENKSLSGPGVFPAIRARLLQVRHGDRPELALETAARIALSPGREGDAWHQSGCISELDAGNASGSADLSSSSAPIPFPAPPMRQPLPPDTDSVVYLCLPPPPASGDVKVMKAATLIGKLMVITAQLIHNEKETDARSTDSSAIAGEAAAPASFQVRAQSYGAACV